MSLRIKSSLYLSYILTLLSHTHAFTQCLPQFSLKDGWLGGDNAISVTLNNNRVAWFFSDSFVASPTEKTRSASTMVANTMAISTCGANGFSISYYWTNRPGNKPFAYFEDPKASYKYWPAEAFTYNNKLYVFLSLIGPKPEATKDDIFNFRHYGVVLAVISNFEDQPEAWKVRYLNWSTVIPDEWATGTRHGSHYYVFRSTPDRKTSVVRIKLNDLENPESGAEYWSHEKTWKKGTHGSDAQIIFQQYVNGSLNYHPSIQKWVLIYGPQFLSNTIQYRVAAELTGPWSEPKALYQTPESTRDHKSYHATYFCYCGREQKGFTKDGMLCVTYDCNSSDFNRLVNSLSLYFPRVKSLPIRKD